MRATTDAAVDGPPTSHTPPRRAGRGLRARLRGSMRVRLAVAVAVAALPAVLLARSLDRVHRLEDRKLAEEDALRLARIVSARVLQVESGTRQLLTALARLPEIRTADPVACYRLLRPLRPAFDEYGNIGVTTTDGVTLCSARDSSFRGPVNDVVFERVRRSRDFAVGSVSIGPIVKRPVLFMGLPILDEHGRPVRVALASVDMEWLAGQFGAFGLPQGTTVTLLDTEGKVLTRHPDFAQWVGRTIPGFDQRISALFSPGDRTEATYQMRSPADGIERLQGIVKFGTPASGVRYLVLGVPLAQLPSLARRDGLGEILSIFGLLALGVMLAWWLAHRWVVRPAVRLAAASNRLAAGDLSARAGLRHASGELGLLGESFDRMAGAVEERDAALRASEDRFARTLESVEEGIWEYDFERGTSYWSPRVLRMLGYEPGEIVPSLEAARTLTHPDDLERLQRATDAHRRGETPMFDVELRLRRRDGSFAWILSRGKIVRRAPDGTPLRVVGTHSDITERRSLTEQLLQAQRLEAVGRMAGGLAHDFNNLLQVLWVQCSTLAVEAPEVATHEAFGEIERALERTSALVGHLMLLSKGRSVATTALDLNAEVSAFVPMLRRALGSAVALETSLDASAGCIEGDTVQLEQVLLNLALNARDAMPGGGRFRIATRRERLATEQVRGVATLPPGEYAVLEIADTGHGMDAATAGRIFEPFFTTKPEDKGTGLGLSTVYAIVSRWGGSIAVESAPGTGARFTILLPAAA